MECCLPLGHAHTSPIPDAAALSCTLAAGSCASAALRTASALEASFSQRQRARLGRVALGRFQPVPGAAVWLLTASQSLP